MMEGRKMKIEIDLNDILGDEEKVETIQESIHRQVIENLTKVIKDGIKSKIDNAVSKVIDEQIKEAIKEQMPTLVNGLMNCEYVQVDRWGSSTGIKTTFREQLVKAVNENMVYNKDAQYNSDKNMFTKSVDTVIANNLK